jgi:hypothetical protein
MGNDDDEDDEEGDDKCDLYDDDQDEDADDGWQGVSGESDTVKTPCAMIRHDYGNERAAVIRMRGWGPGGGAWSWVRIQQELALQRKESSCADTYSPRTVMNTRAAVAKLGYPPTCAVQPEAPTARRGGWCPFRYAIVGVRGSGPGRHRW